MRYLPHTEEDITAMLKAIGAQSMDDLFKSIPGDCRRKEPMKLEPPLTEWALDRHMDTLASQTAISPDYLMFIGAGSYDHHIPEVIKQLLRRGELFTAYTPYQPEVSQGTLQSIYEYQTLVTRLLNMDVANASMYDGASALAEALLMAVRITKRKKVAVSTAIHPLYRKVVKTYFHPTGYEIMELAYGPDGATDLSALENEKELAAVAVQSPNFFGCIENLKNADALVHANPKTLLVSCFTEPLAYGLYKAPGLQGADIVCGEGQSLGIPRSFGGPGLGIFATRQKYVRNMPGRLVGMTKDLEGRRGFVLTLSTREQHIRREKATSNICSNQGLCATAAAMYMASLGGTGFKNLARLNYNNAQYLKTELEKAGVQIPFKTPAFNEFVIRMPAGSQAQYESLLKNKIILGLPLNQFYAELEDHYLVCATETCTKEDMDRFVKEVTS
ncbi:MAG: aminomethyl-transferring glycine dehydrogenase subunit GcvPA [Desulfobacteraceae bacterium]|nr:aminomethyl-transferring glycine dehydrogenase subunit GcvPA [Desulfobacteraceae bacterium]